MNTNHIDENDIIVCRHIAKEGVKEFYVNNALTPINNIEFVEDQDNPFLDISPSGIQIYARDIIGVCSENGLNARSGRRRNKYTVTVQKGTIKTDYKFVLMSDGNLEVPGGLL